MAWQFKSVDSKKNMYVYHILGNRAYWRLYLKKINYGRTCLIHSRYLDVSFITDSEETVSSIIFLYIWEESEIWFPERWVLSQLRICKHPPPPSLRSGHLDMKDAQCVLKKMISVKFHMTPYRVWSPQAPKRAQITPQKFNSLQKWPNIQGRLELIFCTWNFCMNDFFCAILSFWDMIDF